MRATHASESLIAGASKADILLIGDDVDRRKPFSKNLQTIVAGGVVHHPDVERGTVAVGKDRVQTAGEQLRRLPVDDDD